MFMSTLVLLPDPGWPSPLALHGAHGVLVPTAEAVAEAAERASLLARLRQVQRRHRLKVAEARRAHGIGDLRKERQLLKRCALLQQEADGLARRLAGPRNA